MRFFKLILLSLIPIAIAAAGGMYYMAGREPGPTIAIDSPAKYVGRSTALAVTVAEPDAGAPTITLEQNGQLIPISTGEADMTDHGANTYHGEIGKTKQPALVNGPVKLTVSATRHVFFNLRTVDSTVTRDLEVRLDPPRVSVVSIHHFINLGGAEVRGPARDSRRCRGRCAGRRHALSLLSGLGGLALPIPALRVGFFALRHDQDVNAADHAPTRATPPATKSTTPLEHQPFVKKFVQSKIPIDQQFLDRVVPAIASNTPDLKIDTGTPDELLKGFLEINGNLRKKNGDFIASLAAEERAAHAVDRGLRADGQLAGRVTICRSAHLLLRRQGNRQAGASRIRPRHACSGRRFTLRTPDKVVFADFLGIYGNCVILDHGLGVQSLYAHLSTIGVKVGDAVTKGQELGRTGSTGLAGGDHLHFTMLLQGTPVNPVEWWDQHWLQDRVNSKDYGKRARPSR